MKKVDKDPFSNGTEFMAWYDRNCDRCWKASVYIEKENRYTPYRCAIQRDIEVRAAGGGLISQHTIDATSKADCPNREEKRKHYAKGTSKLPKLF